MSDILAAPEAVAEKRFSSRADAHETLLVQFEHHGPLFHLGGTSDWSVSKETIQFLAKNIPVGAVTLETGAGLSTALFASMAARHICITPDEDEVRRISAFCAEVGIAADTIEFKVDFSENVLPSLRAPPLDLVLIDGGHGFPMPIIDWYYSAMHLKEGGIVLVDDTHLWSVSVLTDFLKADASWRFLGPVGRRALAFEKIAPFSYKEFCFQPYVVKKSRWRSVISKILTAFDLAKSGQISEIARRIRR